LASFDLLLPATPIHLPVAALLIWKTDVGLIVAKLFSLRDDSTSWAAELQPLTINNNNNRPFQQDLFMGALSMFMGSTERRLIARMAPRD
jgi:hypothetical protein